MSPLRNFNFLTQEEEREIFLCPPITFDNNSDRELLAYAIGAAMYCPATRGTIADDIFTQKHRGLTSMVIDLEDAVGDNQVALAEKSLLHQMQRIASLIKVNVLSPNVLPLIFIRVRDVEQLISIMNALEDNLTLITGFVFPKFTRENGNQYFDVIAKYNRNKSNAAPILYAMPILETASIIYKESRLEALLGIKEILDAQKEYVLNVRIGATDFSSLFGLRRSSDMTIYDIAPIRDCVSDIINIFGRMDSPYVISGPVWEYFSNRDRVLKPMLRQTPFEERHGSSGRKMRMDMIPSYMDGLLREVIMDKENGMIGKTVIHPSHIMPVHSLYVVTHEEYMDASSIISNNTGFLGVLKSDYSNKMNEIKPHLNWARRIMARSQIYGVLHEEQRYVTLLSEREATIV